MLDVMDNGPEIGTIAADFLARNLTKIIEFGTSVLSGAQSELQLRLKTAYSTYLNNAGAQYGRAKSFFIRSHSHKHLHLLRSYARDFRYRHVAQSCTWRHSEPDEVRGRDSIGGCRKGGDQPDTRVRPGEPPLGVCAIEMLVLYIVITIAMR